MDELIKILVERDIVETAEEIAMLEKTFFLLLMLPIVTTFTGIARYLIGLKTLSVYTPIVLTFAFYELGYVQETYESDVERGLQFGIVLFTIVFLTTSLIYKLLRRIRMHYVPKTSIVLTSVSVTMIISIFVGTILFERKGLIYLDIFSVIMIATLADRIISIQSRKNIKSSLSIALQTLLISIVTYLLISLTFTEDFAFDYTIFLILILITLNLYIGKFIGLRLKEYWRFRSIIFSDSLEENVKPKKNKKK